eukprot:29204_6
MMQTKEGRYICTHFQLMDGRSCKRSNPYRLLLGMVLAGVCTCIQTSCVLEPRTPIAPP